MGNPFFADGVLGTTASINKVVIGKMPTELVTQDLVGKEAITVFSTSLLIEEIKRHELELQLPIQGIEEKMLPHYLEECLFHDNSDVRRTAECILQQFGERLAVILLCLKRGDQESREQRPEWTEEHWNYWKTVETVILVGGLANSYLGERLKYYAEKVFADANEGYRLVLANDSAYAGLRGCVNYLKHLTVDSANLIFDFGQTFTKRSYVQNKRDEIEDVRVLDSILSKYVEWDVKDPDIEWEQALLLNDNVLKIIKSTIEEVEEKGISVGEEMIISIANYVKDGNIANRGGYGKLRLLAENYAIYLEEQLWNETHNHYKIYLVHDGTAMAAGYSHYNKSVCVSLGTAFGVGFPGEAIRPKKK